MFKSSLRTTEEVEARTLVFHVISVCLQEMADQDKRKFLERLLESDDIIPSLELGNASSVRMINKTQLNAAR